MMRAFRKAQEYIDGIPKFVKKNTMEDTKAFYRRLSCPCQNKKVIHVAGTNGKGSVCAYLQSVLMEAGYSVGLFTSPHLVDIRERIRVDGEYISEKEFAEIFRQVQENCGAEDARRKPETENCSGEDERKPSGTENCGTQAEERQHAAGKTATVCVQITTPATLSISTLWLCCILRKSSRMLLYWKPDWAEGSMPQTLLRLPASVL